VARHRLEFLTSAASDVREAVTRARTRRRLRASTPSEAAGAELSRRLDETRERLKREKPQRPD
jgi:hypothetical protein